MIIKWAVVVAFSEQKNGQLQQIIKVGRVILYYIFTDILGK
jgi:hypothetical protein